MDPCVFVNTDFACKKLCETPAQFEARVRRVEEHRNSDAFKEEGGRGLLGLAKELRPRCEQLVSPKGERISK